MKTILRIDLILLRPLVRNLVLTSLLVGVIVGIAGNSAIMVSTMITVMITTILFYSLVGYDEAGGWERMRLTLPIQRRNVMAGHYASIALCGIVTAIASVALGLAVGPLAGLVNGDVEAFGAGIFGGIAATSTLGLCVALVIVAIMMPLVAKFGFTRGVRLFPITFIVIWLFVMALFSGDGAPAFIANLGTDSLGAIVGATAIVTAAIYLASLALATRLYEGREL